MNFFHSSLVSVSLKRSRPLGARIFTKTVGLSPKMLRIPSDLLIVYPAVDFPFPALWPNKVYSSSERAS